MFSHKGVGIFEKYRTFRRGKVQQLGDLFESPVYMACNVTDILRSRYKCDCLTVCNIIKRMHYYEINSECFISMCSGKMLALHVFNANMLCVHKKPVNSSCVVLKKKMCLMQCRPNMSISKLCINSLRGSSVFR